MLTLLVANSGIRLCQGFICLVIVAIWIMEGQWLAVRLQPTGRFQVVVHHRGR